MKFAALFLTLVSLVVPSISQQHNFSWGVRGPYDVLLSRTTILEPARSPYRTRTANLYYPERGQPGRTIAAINVIDGFGDGTGGTARLWSGGLGQNSTTVRLRSQRGRGLNFTVEIYGH
ncbi:hypothetical protein pipiens_010074 [Culex pipiens pipiens]|uniref:Salivary secreted peptide n=1 Tax=Culex pipiens pipiens TaxID=38569 RepID=A0ABD1DEW6_CULPP